MSYIEGVDVSWPQGNYHPGNETFVIVGASSADGGELFVQRTYAQQVDNARAAGKQVGHYFFNGNVSPTTAANYFVDHLHDYRKGDYIVLDIESSESGHRPAWNPTQAQEWVTVVAGRLQIKPGSIGLYMNRSDNKQPGWETLVSLGCWLWIAWPGAESAITTGAWPTWNMWQYTIRDGVDRNYAKLPTLPAGGSGITIDWNKKMWLLWDTKGTGWLATEEGFRWLGNMQQYNLFKRLINSNQASDRPETYNPEEVQIMIDILNKPVQGAPTTPPPVSGGATAAQIAAEVDKVLKDDFAAVPGAVASEASKRLAS